MAGDAATRDGTSAAAALMVKQNVEPSPATLSTHIVPPISSARRLLTARPRQQAAHADHGVHRRADRVAHRRQDRALGSVRVLGEARLLLELLEQAGVGYRDGRLIREGLQDRGGRVNSPLANSAPPASLLPALGGPTGDCAASRIRSFREDSDATATADRSPDGEPAAR
ncbi:MAG: hypothetical protein U0802_25645, partial [Candidatus Binatia bacterium]